MIQSLIRIPLTDFPLPHCFIHQNHWASKLDRILRVLELNLRKVLQIGVGKGVKGHQHGTRLKAIPSLSSSSKCLL
jgi:hypothetical protein